MFEIHDIILHRLWKWRKKKLYAFIGDEQTLGSLVGLLRTKEGNAKYKRLKFWERVTRQWYFNHFPKNAFVR